MANGFSISSPAFAPGGAIPRRHTCEGDDVSPPLRWTNPPAGTQAFALVVDDRTARGFVHWVLGDIPADRRELPEGSTADGSGAPAEGRNDFGRRGWGGPCPPPGSGDHEYVFTLLALSSPLGLSGTPSAAEVRQAASGRTLGTAVVEATFGR
jgi:Raf kinase inhibitor-like YbhB/YbcL family protein